MEHHDGGLICKLDEACARTDADAISSVLGENVFGYEPEMEAEHTGDLRCSDAVLAMTKEARKITDGTFCWFRCR
jgi:hypothetical protein